MTVQFSQSTTGLFYENLIKSYVEGRNLVERTWLAEQVEEALADPNCRFLLLTAEPGAGKTAFLAWLATGRATSFVATARRLSAVVMPAPSCLRSVTS